MAAGILAVEVYHAATIRGVLYAAGLAPAAVKTSYARDSLDGTSDLDQGVVLSTSKGKGKKAVANIVPTDGNGIAFSRTPGQVLNVVYLNPGKVDRGGFFPAGVNGDVRVSG